MTSFFYGFAHACEAFFSILPGIGPLMNVLFIVIGSLGTAGWIWYGMKNKEDKGQYKA